MIFFYQGFIRLCRILYAAPSLFVPEKDEIWRMCVDSLALNLQTVKDRYLLPRTDTLLDLLGQAKVCTKMDMDLDYL